jgi:hypothetical protein
MTYNINAEWKEIEGFPNYLISNNGQIFSKTKNVIRKHKRSKNDPYHRIILYNRKDVTFLIHQLVYKNFGCWNPELSIDHINRNPDDNTIGNLRLLTPRQQAFNRKNNNENIGIEVVNGTRETTYKVSLWLNGKTTYFGSFKTLEEAIQVNRKIRADLA